MKPGDFASAVRLTPGRDGMDLGRPLALVSGGPDSVALLRALLELGGEPAVLHVDHGLRGEESREDAEFVRALCERLGVRCEVRRLSLEDGPNVQERAREARVCEVSLASRQCGVGWRDPLSREQDARSSITWPTSDNLTAPIPRTLPASTPATGSAWR